MKNFRRDYKREDALAVCDVNGDGVDEVIIGEAHIITNAPVSGDQRVHIYVIDHNGDLTEVASRDVGFESEDDLACGDVDADGKDEIVVGDSSEDRALIIQVGTGGDEWATWTAAIDLPHGFWGGDRIAVGDVLDENYAVGSDGKAEIIAADTDDNKIHTYEYTGGGGENRGNEITSFDVQFKVNGRLTKPQYDEEDEIACGDVNGDGVDEIIYGNGYDTHKIYVYNARGEMLFEFDAHFDGSDELAAGDVNLDGVDEIITGDASDDSIHVYEATGREIGHINVDYETADGLAVGDVDGDSLVVEELGCVPGQITNQVIAVINAPPKHIGINFYEGEPFYTDFTIEYKNKEGNSRSFSATLVQDVALSFKASVEWGSLISKYKLKLGFAHSWKWKNYESEVEAVKVAEGLTVSDYDYAILLSANVDVCEFKILNPEEMAVIDGEQQYIIVTKPKGVPVLTYKPLMSPQDYDNLGIPQIHTVGNILTYPSDKTGLTHYSLNNEKLSRGFTVFSAEHSFSYGEFFTEERERQMETQIKAYLEAGIETGGLKKLFHWKHQFAETITINKSLRQMSSLQRRQIS